MSGADLKREVAELQLDLINAGDRLQPVPAVERFSHERLGLGRPGAKVSQDAQFLLRTIAGPNPQADVIVGVCRREEVHGEDAAEGVAIEFDFHSTAVSSAYLGVIACEPTRRKT